MLSTCNHSAPLWQGNITETSGALPTSALSIPPSFHAGWGKTAFGACCLHAIKFTMMASALTTAVQNATHAAASKGVSTSWQP
eukprot:3485514-Amphidinium_carterae.1